MTLQRGRGRPKGDGVNDDPALMAIAVKLVTGDAQDYEEAAASVYLTHKPKRTHVRKTVMDRWRGKWNDRGEVFLAQAQKPVVRMVRPTPKPGFPITAREIVQNVQRVYPMMHLGAGLKNIGIMTEPFYSQQQAIIERLNSPMARPALDRIRSGEINTALSVLRKHQL